MTTAEQLQDLLELRTAPVALTFRQDAPADVPHVSAAAPSGCSYWKRAAEGETFYTEASDHYGCPIGAHTHGVDLPPAQAKELEGVVGMMLGLHYLGAESGLMARPTCAVVPEVVRTRRCAASLGCIGNRVYTGLADDELYFSVP